VVNIKNEKPKDKDWKVKKVDVPGPGQYKETLKAFNMTVQSSP